MKRCIRLLAAILLLAFCVSSSVAESVTFSTPYFTLQLPEDWSISNDEPETNDNAQYLGAFADSADIGLVVVAYLVYYEDLKNVALWSSDTSDLEAYAEAVLEDFAEDSPEWLGVVTAGKIPFVLIKGTDQNGDYLYADTLTNGYAIELTAYIAGPDGDEIYPVTDGYIEQFKDILMTFQPVA